MGGSEIAGLIALPGEQAMSARVANGSWLSMSSNKMRQLAKTKIEALRGEDFDLIVLMCTGVLLNLKSGCLTINAQRALEAAVMSVAAHGEAVGMIYPLEKQLLDSEALQPPFFKIASCYAGHENHAELAQAAEALKECAYIILNSVGYTEEDRSNVFQATGKPVILPRLIVGNSIRLILSGLVLAPPLELTVELQAKLDSLTVRERQVMSLVCESLSNKAIARQLGISHKTVEIHRSNMLRKMEAISVVELTRNMVLAGLS
jgi:DNA-binding NarL/FixJ family response regulator